MEKICVKTGRNIQVCVSKNVEAEITCAAEEFVKTVELLLGERPQISSCESDSTEESVKVILSLFDGLSSASKKALGENLKSFESDLKNTDGFAVCRAKNDFYILSHKASGVYYGAHDFLEKNTGVLWPRGADDYAVDFLPLGENGIEISVYDYAEKSPFVIRAWNMCGIGSEGKQHLDDGTAICFAKNKQSGTFHVVSESWKKHGLRGNGVVAGGVNNIDDLIDVHPEYFMTDIEGGPKHAIHESFINYYNQDVAKEVAKRFVEFLKDKDGDDIYELIMPDNPYFCMKKNGVELSAMPFTTDDGNTVLPTDENYKSTVYFNYMNRVVKEINKLRPNTYLMTFAYIYSEPVPATKIDEHLIVSLAPIMTNEKYSYIDESGANKKIENNIRLWSQVCETLCIYAYWNSFKGTIYTRPILRQIQEDLLWFEKLGVYGLTPEGKLDCSIVENMDARQKGSRVFFDMNEACTWVMNKLMWDPRLDIDELLTHYAKVVYKETAKEFLDYYYLIEQGFDSADSFVWYPTGGDVYILQFIVNAGIKDKVLELIHKALDKSTTPTVRSRWTSICEVLDREIKKYADFVKEDGSILQVKEGVDILSQEALDYKNNPDSIWNKTVPMKVLRDYSTMEFYDKKANFECRMLFDGKVWYIGYSIEDDQIQETIIDTNGHLRIVREDGSRVDSYAETYIGGNVFNQSVYYGYISGFQPKAGGQFYENDGSPKNKKVDGLKDYYFVKTASEKEKRYYFHVQAVPLTALRVTESDFKPYGSFVYYTDRYDRAGWMGFGLWSKQNFQAFEIKKED